MDRQAGWLHLDVRQRHEVIVRSVHKTLLSKVAVGARGSQISELHSSALREIEPRLDYEQPHEPAGSAASNPSMG